MTNASEPIPPTPPVPTPLPHTPLPPAKSQRGGKDWLGIILPMVALTLVASAAAWHFVKPAPPTHVVIATGSKQGIYYAMAQKYARYFGANGLTLEVRPTDGSVENFRLLNDPNSGVDIAIVQAGSSPPADQRPHIQAVAGIYYEPVMVFYRSESPITRLPQLAGKKIAIGADGSGVRVMAKMLLDEAGIADKVDGSTLLPLGGDPAAEALSTGTIDAAFYVIAPDAPVVARLLGTPGIRLMSFDNARADGRLHPFLSQATLYQGSVDIHRNLPPHDVQLVAAPATIATRDTTHQAVIQLLVRAAQESNAGATLLSDAGTFPLYGASELPPNHDALYFLKNPPSILHRTLPFWLASMIDRLIIMVLPLLVVLIPLARMAPPLLRWRTQRKLQARYKRVRHIEETLSPKSEPAEIASGIAELYSMDREIATLKAPISFAQDLYSLRVHVGHARHRLEKWLQPTATPAT